MKPDLWAVIPVKPFELGKSRLAGVLDAPRPRGAQPEAVRSCVRHGGRRARRRPRRGGDVRRGAVRHDRCARRARRRRRRRFERRTRPGVPIRHRARREGDPGAAERPAVPVRGRHRRAGRRRLPPAPSVVIAPDASEQATNALVLSPPDPDFFRFGPSSFAAHLQAARARGATIETVRRPGLAFDLDTPDDLSGLCQPHVGAGSILTVSRPRCCAP